jgi:hypothetical protein
MKKHLKTIITVCFALSLSFLAGSFIGLAYFDSPLLFGFIATALSCIPLGPQLNIANMAVTQNTLIGRSRQKIGGAVMRSWKGLNVLQSKPLTVANPKTDKQKAQRSALSQLVAMFRQYLSFIRIAFNEMPQGTTQWAQLMKFNLKTGFTFTPPNATLKPDSLRLSSGTLIGAQDLTFTNPSGRNILIQWTDNSGQPGANSSDRAVAVILSGTGEIYYIATGSNRTTEGMQFDVPGSTPFTQLHLYFYFDNSSLRKASDSQYIDTLA